jgi:integrase
MSKRGNGEGSLRKRPDGRWEGRYTAGRDARTGRLVTRSVYAWKRAECKAKLDAAIEASQGVSIYASDKLTVAEWLQVYLWQIKRERVKPTTFDDYVTNTEGYIMPSSLASMKMNTVRRFHVQAFVDELTSAEATPFVVRNVYGVLRNAFREAERKGIIPISYANGAELPARKPKPMAIFTQAQQTDFMIAIKGHRLEAAFIAALTTGLREGELAALTWSDYADGTLSVTKNAASVSLYDPRTNKKTGSKVIIQDSPKTTAGVRNIPVLPITARALDKHRIIQNNERMRNRLLYSDSGFIFCNELGGMYEPSYYGRVDVEGRNFSRFFIERILLLWYNRAIEIQ